MPVATRLEPFQVRRPFVMNPVVLSPIVPESVIVPPVKPLFVAIEVTVPNPPCPRQVPEGIRMQPLES